MTTPSTLFRSLLLVLLTSLPGLAQTVTGTVTAATQLIVSAGFPPANTNTRPAGTNLTGGLNLGTSWALTPLFVTVNSVFGYSATTSAITHTINESMTGVNAPVSAGPHSTLLTLTASQPVTGTLIVQNSPGTNSSASIDIGNDGSVEWTRAAGSTFQQQVTVYGSLPIRVSTAMVSSAHSLSVRFTNWAPLPQLPLANNGFENGLTGWIATGPAATGSANVTPRSGFSQCQMTGSASVAQVVAASGGETFALHCHSAKDLIWAPGDLAVARLQFLGATGAVLGGPSATVLDVNSQRFVYVESPTIVATAPPGTLAVRVTLQYLQTSPGGFCCFDDVSFQRVNGCGAFTMPIGPASGSGTAKGWYFTLRPSTQHGASICGIDLVTTAAAGTAIDATIYQHRSLTGAMQLTTAQASAENWCPLASLHGVSNGPGQATPFAIANATNSLELPSGQRLLAILLDSTATDSFQFTPSGLLAFADAGTNLQLFYGGSLNDGFGGGNPLVTGYVPTTFHFEILTAPAVTSRCAAETVAVGTPCGGEPNSVFEMLPHSAWDLTGSDVVVTGNGSGASLSTVPATPLDPVVTPPEPQFGGIAGPFPLGFSLDAFGKPNINFLLVGLNGQVFFGGQSIQPGYPSASAWSSDPVARLAACSDAYTAGSIHVENHPGAQTTITFANLSLPGANQDSTFQVVITPTTMRVRYDPASWFQGVVGFHNGIVLPVPPTASQVDLTAGPTPFTSPNAGPDVTLAVLSRPLLGANFDFRLDNCAGPCLAFIDFAHAGGGVPLPTPLFAAGCKLYIGTNPALSFGLSPGVVASSFTPNNTAFLGYEFALQAGGLLPSGQLGASNAYNGIVGNW